MIDLSVIVGKRKSHQVEVQHLTPCSPFGITELFSRNIIGDLLIKKILKEQKNKTVLTGKNIALCFDLTT